MDKINETFGYTNTIAVLVPRGDYDSEGAVPAGWRPWTT